MQLVRTWVDEAPDPAMVRISGEVAYRDRRGAETYWFDLPRQHASQITTTGNAWAVALLPLAAALGEPLELGLPVDSTVRANLKELMQIWRSWYPKVRVVPIVADQADNLPASEPGRTVTFFSGGLDSFFTLLRDREADGEPPVDDLLWITGLDVPLSNPEACRRASASLQRVADEAGKTLVIASTNLRETRWNSAGYGVLAHANGLVGLSLFLEPRWTRVLVASSYGYAFLHPWGSHPLTDRLLSTARTTVVHDGAGSTRVEKTRTVAVSPLAMRSLRVCWRSASDANCGACEKCYRTMTTLWLLGALERCSTFPAGSFDPGRIDRIFCRSEGSAHFMQEIRELALTTGRGDVVRAIDRALTRSRRVLRAQAMLKRIGNAVDARMPHRGRWLRERVERRLLRHALR